MCKLYTSTLIIGFHKLHIKPMLIRVPGLKTFKMPYLWIDISLDWKMQSINLHKRLLRTTSECSATTIHKRVQNLLLLLITESELYWQNHQHIRLKSHLNIFIKLYWFMTHVYYLKRPLQALIMKVVPLLMNIHECIVQLILAIFQPFFMHWTFFVEVDTGKMAKNELHLLENLLNNIINRCVCTVKTDSDYNILFYCYFITVQWSFIARITRMLVDKCPISARI